MANIPTLASGFASNTLAAKKSPLKCIAALPSATEAIASSYVADVKFSFIYPFS